MSRVLIAGCGYVGAALGTELAARGHSVWGLRRRPLSLPEGVLPIAADLAVPFTLEGLPSELDVVFYMVAPAGREEALYRAAYVDGLRHLLEALQKQGQRPSRVFFVSSTAVYAQQNGEWVDETSPTEPVDFTGSRLLEAEAMLSEGPFPGVVVRFGGIYGPRRTQLVDRVRAGRAEYDPGRPRYTNRIHRDDCAGALAHLMRMEEPAPLYLGVDCEPADERSVLTWLAGALGAQPPRKVSHGRRSPRARGGNKRCRNDRLLGTGYAFRYPTYREGYSALIAGMT
jgi:nucleoside-diphosphate-sugar epimerase